MLLKRIVSNIFLYLSLFAHAVNASQPVTSYLSKPNGKYGVAFKDLHWINHNLCPDPNFSKKYRSYFNLDNQKYCHELIRQEIPAIFLTRWECERMDA